MTRSIRAVLFFVLACGWAFAGLSCDSGGGGGNEGKDAVADTAGVDTAVPGNDTEGPGVDVVPRDDLVTPSDLLPQDNVAPQDIVAPEDNVVPPEDLAVADVPEEKVEEPAGNPGHTESMSGVMHKPGKNDPLKNCVGCHGADLKGGGGPSCYMCHNSNDHTKSEDGVMHKSGSTSTCNACHGPNNSGGLGPACKKCH